MNMRKLPIYDAVLEDTIDGVYAIAMVNSPAMEVEWALFNKDKQSFNVNDDKMVITYPIIVADKPIYRTTPFEHYIKFTKETIKEMALRFHKNGVNKFNEMHTDKEIEDKLYIFESWLKGDSDKANNIGFENVPTGSWFISIQVKDKEYWENVIKKGEFKGLSMEVFYEMYSKDIKLENFVKSLIYSNLDDEIVYSTLQNYLKNNTIL